MKNERLFYAIPLRVLREFVRINKDEPDTFVQLFELTPDSVFSETELSGIKKDIKEKGIVIYGKGELC